MPAPAVGYSGAGFFVAGLKTEAEFVMVRFRTLWYLLGVVGWRQYYYCTNCRRPYYKSEIRTGEMVQVSDSSFAPALYCASCNQSVHHPSPFLVQLIMLLFFFIPMLLPLLGPGEWEAPSVFPLLSGITGLLVFLSSLAWSQKYKVIYDHWVMHYGPNPEKWPAPVKSE